MARHSRIQVSAAGLVVVLLLGIAAASAREPSQAPPPAATPGDDDPGILTPPPPREPRINGPSAYGVRPGRPFLYRIPATGDRPMRFSVQDLPSGLTLYILTNTVLSMAHQWYMNHSD